MSSLPGGPAYTVLRVGDTSVPGIIAGVFQSGTAGILVARPGNFPSSDFVPNPSALDVGVFQFTGEGFSENDVVTFDILEGDAGPYAGNVQKV